MFLFQSTNHCTILLPAVFECSYHSEELSKMNSHPHRLSSSHLCAHPADIPRLPMGTPIPSTSMGPSPLTLPQELAFGLVHDVCREQDGAAHRVLPHGREGGILDY